MVMGKMDMGKIETLPSPFSSAGDMFYNFAGQQDPASDSARYFQQPDMPGAAPAIFRKRTKSVNLGVYLSSCHFICAVRASVQLIGVDPEENLLFFTADPARGRSRAA